MFRRLLTLLLMLALLGAGAVLWWLHRPLELAGPVVEYSVQPGSTPRSTANGWVQSGVRTSPTLLYEWFRWSGKAREIRAGSYEIRRGTTPYELLNKMVRGDETLVVVRLIEGWNFRQVRAALAAAEGLQPVAAAMSDAELMAALGAPGLHPEGQFFPDTYAFSRGSSDLEVLRRAHRAMQRVLAEVWASREDGLPLKSPAEALVLASIVEKETGLESDRARVAGVFINRLRIGMPLQTDPTVIYGLGEAFDGNLRKRDLLADGPYNTYQRNGLPPTPIAIPGRASLRAAVQPERTRALYFVARGDGSSVFSENLADHNRAVNQYQRGGR